MWTFYFFLTTKLLENGAAADMILSASFISWLNVGGDGFSSFLSVVLFFTRREYKYNFNEEGIMYKSEFCGF